MKSVALIGSKGYIGKHLEWYLKQQGYHVDSYDIVSDTADGYRQLNITKREQMNLINLDVDYVYMFAGLTGTKAAFDRYEEYYEINEIGLNHLLDAIRKSRFRPRVVFPSSRLVYKGAEAALKECDEKEAKTLYAVNKLASEYLLNVYANMYDIPYTIFRICVPFGNMLDRDYSFGTIGFFIRQAKEKGLITLYGNGQTKRTFTSMENLCSQIVQGVSKYESLNQTYNIGGCTHTLLEVAEEIASLYDASVKCVPFPEDDLRIESGSTYFDSSKIEKLLGIKSFQDIDTLF